jgi:hypothetical protein
LALLATSFNGKAGDYLDSGEAGAEYLSQVLTDGDTDELRRTLGYIVKAENQRLFGGWPLWLPLQFFVRQRALNIGAENGDAMPTLDDVYRKFGETSEAAQLLETELGTMLLMIDAVEADLIENPDSERAAEIYRRINKHTPGQLIVKLGSKNVSVSGIEVLLSQALKARNRLAHSFYLQHNLRRNSDDGRAVMMKDLESMHEKLLDAYKAVLQLLGIDLDKLTLEQGDALQPKGHLPI